MSKVQDAINKSRKRRGSTGHSIDRDVKRAPERKPPAVPGALKGRPTLELDAAEMERSFLLPFARDKGATNAYNLLRTRLLKRMRDNQWSSLMVSGTLPNEGKSVTAMNLAIAASQDVGQSVLLVDMDLERPSVAQALGLKRTAGLSDYLLDEARLEETIYSSDIDRLFVLPNFEPARNAESIVSVKMLALLDYIRKLDDDLLVIFDMPPVLSSDSVLALAPHVDSILFVVSDGLTNRNLLKRAHQMIEDIPRVGTVINRSLEVNEVGYY